MKKNLIIALISILFSATNCFANESTNTVSVKLDADAELIAVKTTKINLKLTDIISGNPVGEKDLKIAHTKKLHLLIIDPTLTDYQHIHPVETANSGEFTFDFTPKNPGDYRFFADITPVKSGTQEYVIANLGKPVFEKPAVDKTTNMEAIVEGYKFKLLFDGPLAAGKATMGSLKVEDKDGKPLTKLEPVLGAFAHIVGFDANRESVTHIHPMGKEPEAETDRAGPELSFHIEPKTTGFTKLFAQVKIDGKDIFVPFGLMVGNAVARN